MNDIRSRLEALADDATANVQLRNPRLVPTRRRTWRTWFAGVLAALLAGVASLAGGNVILNTGDRSDISTVEGPQTTADPSRPTVGDGDEDAPTSSTGLGPEVPPTSVTPPGASTDSTPSGSVPADSVPSSPPSTGTTAPRRTVADRYGLEGPQEAVAPNDGSDGTAGSGCRPGSPGGLPDGIWMTFVTAFSTSSVSVDILCFRTVESSDEVIEDWDFSNDNTQSRTVPLADDAQFHLQTVPPPHFPGEATETRAFDDPVAAGTFAAQSGDATPMAWVVVEGGKVVEVYSPPLGSA